MKKLYIFLLLGTITQMTAQDIDVAFNTGTGFDGEVNTIVLQPDGKILAGGEFDNFNDTLAKSIIRLNADGSIDTAFDYGTGFSGSSFNPNHIVYSILLQPDGKILVGGLFAEYNGTTMYGIARLNTDGSIDTSFTPGLNGNGISGTIHSIALQPDGKILVSGDVSLAIIGDDNMYNYYVGVIRLNTDGSIDTSFVSSTGYDVGAGYALALQSDGKVLVGTGASPYSNFITRLNTDGTKDTTFNTAVGGNGAAYAVLLQPDGKILCGGNFASYAYPIDSQSVDAQKIIRLNADGSPDTSFQYGTGFNGEVKAFALQSDGKILVGGSFGVYNENNFSRKLIRLNSDGSVDNSFNVGNNITPNHTEVLTIAIQEDQKIVIGGTFTNYGSNVVNHIARVTNGELSTPVFTNESTTLYPNPAKDILNFSEMLDKVEVYTLDGKKVMSANNISQLNISGFTNGIYLIQAQTAEGRKINSKFIKN